MKLGITIGAFGIATLLSAGSAVAGSGCSCSSATVVAAPAQTPMTMSQAPVAPPQAPASIAQGAQTYRSFSYENGPAMRSSAGAYQRSTPARSHFDASSKALGRFGRSW